MTQGQMDEAMRSLGQLIDVMRAKGVTSVRWPEGEVVLGPPPDVETKPEPTIDAELCGCGHPLHAHVNGLCVVGCDVEKCAPPEVAP